MRFVCYIINASASLMITFDFKDQNVKQLKNNLMVQVPVDTVVNVIK